jgi:hypothetical protein
LDFALLLVLVRRLLNGIVADLRDLSERGHRAVMLIHGSVTIARRDQTFLLNKDWPEMPPPLTLTD